ncbi:hypothetical protein [Williamsia sp. 1135]|uniref:hypothetical protein n=1 Tax=Williamsia sp. 1135 TaxID=1889262 RepID=UPI000A10E9B3|nr:hypothetical protein [Williamsia sp. 1135]ORM37155.1 hypothetical protein BFL43_05180 [Williamsia sp. 1135]
MVMLAEIDRWNPAQLGDVFRICTEQNQHCVELSQELQSPSLFQSWGGESARAASNSADQLRRDLDSHGNQLVAVAAAVSTAQIDVENLKSSLARVRGEIAATGFEIDPSDKVFHPNPPPLSSVREHVAINGYQHNFQKLVEAIKRDAERIDRELAAVIDVADGDLPGGNLAGDLADRKGNATRAFEEVYGRKPVTQQEWSVASMLDTQSYDPKNRGVPAEVTVIKIEPVPGQGIVRSGLFIPTETVFAGPEAAPHLGDNRGFDEHFNPEDTRVAFVVDYENGYIVARQNPSVTADGHVETGRPKVTASQLDDGTVSLDYQASDPFAPEIASDTFWSVNGKLVLSPVDGDIAVAGRVTDFPSMEIYQDKPDGSTATIHRDDAADHVHYGPVLNLPFHHYFGDYGQASEPFSPDSPYYAPSRECPINGGSDLDVG